MITTKKLYSTKRKTKKNKRRLVMKGGADAAFHRTLHTKLKPPPFITPVPQINSMKTTHPVKLINPKQIYNSYIKYKDIREHLFSHFQKEVIEKNICEELHEHYPDCVLRDPVIANLFNSFQCDTMELKIQLEETITILDLEKEDIDLKSKLAFQVALGEIEIGISNLEGYLQTINFDTNNLFKLKKIMGKRKLNPTSQHSIQNLIYLIDTISFIKQVMFLNCLLQFINYTEISLSQSKREDLYYYLGDRPDAGDYLGTCYNHDYTYDTIGDIVIIKETQPRDMFLLNYNYTSGTGESKKKLPFYRSSGKSYSALQKDLISPFNGYSLVNQSHKSLSKVNRIYEDFFLECESYICTEEGELYMNETGNFVTKKIKEKWSSITKKLYTGWYIKFSSLLYYNNRTNNLLFVNKPYEKWNRSNDMHNLIGLELYQEQCASGNVIQQGNAFTFKDMNLMFKTREFEELKRNPDRAITETMIRKHKDLFFNRYKGNKSFYSFRNLSMQYTSEKISHRKLNEKIGSNNIYNYDMSRLEDVSNNEQMNNKLLSYIFEYPHYSSIHDHDKVANNFNDINKVMEIAESPLHLTFKPIRNGYLQCEDNNTLYEILDKLKELQIKIMEGPSSYTSLKYKDTLFYKFITLPFYNNIKPP